MTKVPLSVCGGQEEVTLLLPLQRIAPADRTLLAVGAGPCSCSVGGSILSLLQFNGLYRSLSLSLAPSLSLSTIIYKINM